MDRDSQSQKQFDSLAEMMRKDFVTAEELVSFLLMSLANAGRHLQENLDEQKFKNVLIKDEVLRLALLYATRFENILMPYLKEKDASDK